MFKIKYDNYKYISLINLDKYNHNYLIPLFVILLFKNNSKINYKLVNWINLDKVNPKYLIPLFLILSFKK